MSTTSRGLRPFSPQSFGRYTLLTQLATGGMGALYLARISGAEGFQKLVVIKKILPQLAQEPAFVERFVDEARMVVQLQHGSIAQVLDMDSEAGEYYIAMEFVDGKDLRKIAARARELKRPIPAALALFILVRVLDALAYAHRKKDEQGRELNLVHRDISPQNVLISYEGEVKVIDFGLAKSAQTLGRTQPHMVLGKFFYMAPEVARHVPADRRSDLYAAGICLWELLAGKNPFDEIKPHDILRAAASPEIPPIRAVRPELPASLEAALQKALAVDPSQRYQSAEEMRGRLTAAMLELDPTAGPESLASLVRSFFAAEYESERRALSTLSRWKAEPAADGPSTPLPRQSTEMAAPPQPVPLSRQATEIMPPGFTPGEPELPTPAARPGASDPPTVPVPLLAAAPAAKREGMDPPTVPVPVLRLASPASPDPARRSPPSPAAPAPLGRRSTPEPLPAPQGATAPLSSPQEAHPRGRAGGPAPSGAPSPPEAAKGKAASPPDASESTVFISPEFLAGAGQSPAAISSPPKRAAGAGVGGSAKPAMRRPTPPGGEAASAAAGAAARPERGGAKAKAPRPSPEPDADLPMPASRRRLYYLGAALGLAAVAVSGISLLMGRGDRDDDTVQSIPTAALSGSQAPTLQAPMEARPSTPPPPSQAPGLEQARPAEASGIAAVPTPPPAAPETASADPAPTPAQAAPARELDARPLNHQDLKRRVKALHDSIARDLKELSAQKRCEDIGYTCLSWESIEKQYAAKLSNPSEKNLRDLEKLLEQSRAALEEAKAGSAGAPR